MKKAELLQLIERAVLTLEKQDLVDISGLIADYTVESEYKVYTAMVDQTGTDAPVATVLKNGIGTVAWARTGAGVYTLTSDNLFTLNKTVILTNAPISHSNEIGAVATDADVITLTSNVITMNAGDFVVTATDAVINGLWIEIRVYE